MNRYKLGLAVVVLLVCAGSAMAVEVARKDDAQPVVKVVKGLTAKLVDRKITRERRGRKFSYQALVFVVENVGDKPVLLPSPLEVKFKVKDAAGKPVDLERDRRGGDRRGGEEAAQEEKPVDKTMAVSVSVLKPGQKLEIQSRDLLRLMFRASGKVKVSAEAEVKENKEELLPGIKMWFGKLEASEVEWTIPAMPGRDRGNRGNRGNRDRTSTPPAEPKPPVENF